MYSIPSDVIGNLYHRKIIIWYSNAYKNPSATVILTMV